MTSLAQREANRANGQQSTGPRSEGGKARSARNAVRHGLLSGSALLDTEDRQAYDDHCLALREALGARGPWEELLADRVAAQAWRLRRATWMETCILDNAMRDATERDDAWRKHYLDAARKEAREKGLDDSAVPDPNPPRPWPKAVRPCYAGVALADMMAGPSSLDVLRRYERAIERGLYQAMRELQAAQKARAEGGAEGCRSHDPAATCAGTEARASRGQGPASGEDRAAGVGVTPGIQFYGDWTVQERAEALRDWATAMEEAAARKQSADETGCHGPASSQDRAERAESASPRKQQQVQNTQQPILNSQVEGPADLGEGNCVSPAAAEEAPLAAETESCETNPISPAPAAGEIVEARMV